MPTAEGGTTRHWLLPHERWLGRFAGRPGDPPPSGKGWCFSTQLRPWRERASRSELGWSDCAGILCFTGLILLVVSGSSGPLAAAGYSIGGIGILTALMAMVRGVSWLIRAGSSALAGRSSGRGSACHDLVPVSWLMSPRCG
jgi:hypothetical protein